jgi:hypothetical protein
MHTTPTMHTTPAMPTTLAPGATTRIMVRPEALSIVPGSDASQEATTGDLRGTIVERRFAGAATLYRVRVGDVDLSILGRAGDARPGDPVRLRLDPDAVPLAFAPPVRLPTTPAAEPTPATQKVSPNPTVTVGT